MLADGSCLDNNLLIEVVEMAWKWRGSGGGGGGGSGTNIIAGDLF